MAFLRKRGTHGWYSIIDKARNYTEPLKTSDEKLANLALKKYHSEQFLKSQGLQIPGEKKSLSGKTFAEFKKEYLIAIRKSTIKYSYYEKIAFALKKFEALISPDLLTDITESDCEKWQNMLLNTPLVSRNGTRRIIASTTVRGDRSYLNVFFNKAVRLEHIKKNPFDDLPPISVPKSLPRHLSKDQQERVLQEYKNYADTVGNPAIFIGALLMLWTGRRVSEICHILWENVDKNGHSYKLCKMPCNCFACKNNNGIYTTKNRADLFVNVVDEPLRHLLKKHWKPTGRVVGMSKVGFDYVSRSVFNRAGIKERGILNHSLRHSSAVTQLEAGAHISAIGQMLGHQSLSSTIIYTKLNDAGLKAELSKVKRAPLPS